MSRQAQEVLNYVEAATAGMIGLAKRPIGLRLLAELQAILVRGTRGESFDSGQLRQRQVVGSEGLAIERARFVPPPPEDELIKGSPTGETWIHAETDCHLLVKVALGHYQFETLHPFSDGNGRLGRLVVALQLIEGGALRLPF